MARFFFHIREKGRVDPDEDGVGLPDAETAYAEALKAARDMAEDAALVGRDLSNRSFEVTDGKGNALFTLPFSLAAKDGGRRSLH